MQPHNTTYQHKHIIQTVEHDGGGVTICFWGFFQLQGLGTLQQSTPANLQQNGWERKELRWRSGPVEVQTSERAVHKQMPTKYNGLKKSCKAKWAPQKNHTVNNHFKLLHCIVILFHRTAKSHVSPFHITGDVFEPNWAMKSTTDLFFVSSLMWLVTKKKCWWQKQNSTNLWNCCFTKRPLNRLSAFLYSVSHVQYSVLPNDIHLLAIRMIKTELELQYVAFNLPTFYAYPGF